MPAQSSRTRYRGGKFRDGVWEPPQDYPERNVAGFDSPAHQTVADWLYERYGYPSDTPFRGSHYLRPGALNPYAEALRFGALGTFAGMGAGAVRRAFRRANSEPDEGALAVWAPAILGLLGGAAFGALGGHWNRRGLRAKSDKSFRGMAGDYRQKTASSEKRAQLFSSATLTGRTLADLYRAIQADPTMAPGEKQRLLQQIAGLTGGAPPGTPLGILMSRGLGGAVGLLISRYFGAGPVGQAVSTLVGAGVGRRVYDQLNRPPAEAPGWKVIR